MLPTRQQLARRFAFSDRIFASPMLLACSLTVIGFLGSVVFTEFPWRAFISGGKHVLLPITGAWLLTELLPRRFAEYILALLSLLLIAVTHSTVLMACLITGWAIAWFWQRVEQQGDLPPPALTTIWVGLALGVLGTVSQFSPSLWQERLLTWEAARQVLLVTPLTGAGHAYADWLFQVAIRIPGVAIDVSRFTDPQNLALFVWTRYGFAGLLGVTLLTVEALRHPNVPVRATLLSLSLYGLLFSVITVPLGTSLFATALILGLRDNSHARTFLARVRRKSRTPSPETADAITTSGTPI